jgi:hypothetical protein
MRERGAGHTFHVPVMGTGFTIDTPVRIGKYGIASVVSLVDDNLIEKVRRTYAKKWQLPYRRISSRSGLDRARRITAYFDLMVDILELQIAAIKALPFQPDNEKAKYFDLLPDSSPTKALYQTFLHLKDPSAKTAMEDLLNQAIVPGRLACNIMTKVDAARYDTNGEEAERVLTDAKAALKGFADSKCEGDVVLSAGVNPTLFGFIEQFRDFYPDDTGHCRKTIILKVSDVRSSIIQGKLLAKKGIRVGEFRIESGLNCGGHVFATDGLLMGPILEEFSQRRAEFDTIFEPMIQAYYAQRAEQQYRPRKEQHRIRITAQGGLGNAGEAQRLMDYYGLDGTGWATPFLLVPEATALDDDTRAKLTHATKQDVIVSNASPLGIPFNNLRNSSSETWSEARITAGTPGSPCPNGYIRFNTEFEGPPLCIGSQEYMAKKLAALGFAEPPTRQNAPAEVQAMYDKRCICCHLGNGALISLGVARPGLPVAVCPGPNLAYFNRTYSLNEMVDHIYGRGPCLVPEDRPHMFAAELVLYVDHFEKRLQSGDLQQPRARQALRAYLDNLNNAFLYYRKLAAQEPFPMENLASLRQALDEQEQRLQTLANQIPTEPNKPTATSATAVQMAC